MSRIANAPINIPNNVDVKLEDKSMTIKGSKGQMFLDIQSCVDVSVNDNIISIKWDKTVKNSSAYAGTVRARLNNMVEGVTNGFEKKLTLVGVGYRAQVSGKSLNLSLGFSHPVVYSMPEGITIEAPSQTEIVVKGMDKQKVGQVAAEIRAYRPPEPYKGKGIRYADEYVARKAAKKK